jgi:hypothetical protein
MSSRNLALSQSKLRKKFLRLMIDSDKELIGL